LRAAKCEPTSASSAAPAIVQSSPSTDTAAAIATLLGVAAASAALTQRCTVLLPTPIDWATSARDEPARTRAIAASTSFGSGVDCGMPFNVTRNFPLRLQPTSGAHRGIPGSNGVALYRNVAERCIGTSALWNALPWDDSKSAIRVQRRPRESGWPLPTPLRVTRIRCHNR